MKFINKLAEKEGFLKAMIGEEGVHFEIKEGEYWPLDPLFVDRKNAWFFTPFAIEGYKPMWMARLRAGAEHTLAYTTMVKQVEGFGQPEYLNMAPPMDNVAKYQTSSEQFIKDECVKFIAGANSMDQWDAFADQYMKEKGGEAMEMEYNEWFKSFK